MKNKTVMITNNDPKNTILSNGIIKAKKKNEFFTR